MSFRWLPNNIEQNLRIPYKRREFMATKRVNLLGGGGYQGVLNHYFIFIQEIKISEIEELSKVNVPSGMPG